MDSSSGTRKASSTRASLTTDVTRPSPMPSVMESPDVDLGSPVLNKLYIAKPGGSAQAVTMFLFFDFRNEVVPAMVPAVPTEQIKPSTLPPVCSQISGPVDSKCAFALSRLFHWSANSTPFGSVLRN